MFRSSQNEWVQGQSSHGNFSLNQQNHQYPEATTSHYSYNYSSNNNRIQQQYSNNYNYQQQQKGGAGYSYQSYYSYGYQCPNGYSRSSGASLSTNDGNTHHVKEDSNGLVIASQENNAKEQRKVNIHTFLNIIHSYCNPYKMIVFISFKPLIFTKDRFFVIVQHFVSFSIKCYGKHEISI